MQKAKMKLKTLFFIAIALIIISPSIILAGGFLQEKIQKSIGNRQNIGYQTVAPPELQYEPYYQNEQMSQIGGANRVATEETRIRRVTQQQGEGRAIASHAIYRADYKAEIEEDVVTVKGNVLFEVFRKGWTQIPLVKSNVGLIDVAINRGASFVTMQGDRYFLMIDKPGRYNLDIEFLIKASREREGGPGSFNLEVIPAPISQFEFTMPETGVEIFVEPAIRVELKKEAKRTIAWAVMPNTNAINVRWSKALPKETITVAKLEPKVYADTAVYASIGEGLIRCNTNFNYSILQSEISSLRIALPEDVSVLEVKGKDLRDWKVSQEQGSQYLDVYLSFGTKGNYTLNLIFERKIGEGSVVAQIPWIKCMGAEREKGYFGLAAATNVELAVNKAENVTLIDVKELPPSIWSSTTSPILLAFKYIKQPFNIEIEVTKHEEVPVLVAAIDSANYVTLHTEEGKSLTKAIYQVRNNVKQFIHLVLPKNADIWSAFVAGKPVKPAKDKNGNILVPLEKSQLQGESLTRFPVEIVYLDQNSKMNLLGNIKLNLPQTDIPVNSLNWAVYLPVDYTYFNFGGDVKHIKERRYFAPFVGVQGRMRSASDELGVQFAPAEVKKEFESLKMKGVLPIKIDIPEEGRLYRFSKLLVTEKDSPWLSVSFITVLKQTHGILRFLIFVAIVVFIANLVRKRIKKKPLILTE